MTPDIQTQILIQVDTIAVLTNAVCAYLMWRFRKDVTDRSRYILGTLFLLTVIPFSVKVQSLMTSGLGNRFIEVLAPPAVFGSVLTIVLMLFYAIEVIRPGWIKSSLRITTLIVLFVFSFAFPTVFKEWFFPLHSADDLLAHIGEANVILRLVFITMTSFIVLILLQMPYQWRKSSADRRWIVTYVCFTVAIGIGFFTWVLTMWMPAQIFHNLFPTLFAVYYTYYELVERIAPAGDMVNDETEQPPVQHEDQTVESDLFLKMDRHINQHHLFTDPDFGRDQLCRLTGLSRKYRIS
ncbi:MAG: hypothetical protein IJV17_03070 [Prevotella sp.]|nr:hypothetical protein [Prevotella sp.]